MGALVGAKVLVLLQHIDVIGSSWERLLLLLVQGKTVVGALLGGLIGVELTKKMIGVKQSTGDTFVYPQAIKGIYVSQYTRRHFGILSRSVSRLERTNDRRDMVVGLPKT